MNNLNFIFCFLFISTRIIFLKFNLYQFCVCKKISFPLIMALQVFFFFLFLLDEILSTLINFYFYFVGMVVKLLFIANHFG